MKKLLLTLSCCIASILSVYAQDAAPIVKELREVIGGAASSFQSFRGEQIEADSTNGIVYYKSAHKPEASNAGHFLIENIKTKHRFYLIRYELKSMDVMQLRIMTVMAQKYMDELNAMVKTGKYTGRDYKNAEGADVTEIKDAAGNNVVDYQSSAEQQMLIVYGAGS